MGAMLLHKTCWLCQAQILRRASKFCLADESMTLALVLLNRKGHASLAGPSASGLPAVGRSVSCSVGQAPCCPAQLCGWRCGKACRPSGPLAAHETQIHAS